MALTLFAHSAVTALTPGLTHLTVLQSILLPEALMEIQIYMNLTWFKHNDVLLPRASALQTFKQHAFINWILFCRTPIQNFITHEQIKAAQLSRDISCWARAGLDCSSSRSSPSTPLSPFSRAALLFFSLSSSLLKETCFSFRLSTISPRGARKYLPACTHGLYRHERRET